MSCYVQFIASGPGTLEVQLLTRALEAATGHCEEVEAAQGTGANDFPTGNEHGDSMVIGDVVGMKNMIQPILGVAGVTSMAPWCTKPTLLLRYRSPNGSGASSSFNRIEDA